MNFIRKNKGKISAVFVILIAVVTAYFFGGSEKNDIAVPDNAAETFDAYEEKTAKEPQNTELEKELQTTELTEASEQPQKESAPAENYDRNELFCTLSVRCDTILSDISRLDDEKFKTIPKDGVIFAEKKVAFTEGESVFDLLLREMKDNKIHLEFVNTPIYGSAYIE